LIAFSFFFSFLELKFPYKNTCNDVTNEMQKAYYLITSLSVSKKRKDIAIKKPPLHMLNVL